MYVIVLVREECEGKGEGWDGGHVCMRWLSPAYSTVRGLERRSGSFSYLSMVYVNRVSGELSAILFDRAIFPPLDALLDLGPAHFTLHTPNTHQSYVRMKGPFPPPSVICPLVK